MIDKKIEQAFTAHQEGRLDEAEQFYLSILETEPTNIGVLNNLSVLLSNLNRFDEAKQYCEKTIELNPNFSEGHNNLGLTLIELGNTSDAEISFKKAIDLNPKFVKAYSNLGSMFQKLDRFDEAEINYKKAIELNPNYVEVYNNLGLVSRYLKKLENSIKYYKKAIELKPDFAEAHSNLGITLQQLDKDKEAEVSFKKAIELKPDLAQAYCSLGATFQKLDRFDEAEASYKKAIKFEPDHDDAHENLLTLANEKELLSKILKVKKSISITKNINLKNKVILKPNPFISNRKVESGLIENLYKAKLKDLDKTKNSKTRGPLYGSGKTTDFRFFENNLYITKKIKEDLTEIMRTAVNTDVHVHESFFNIFGKGSGSIFHAHIGSLDKAHNLIDQKFSLQYYLSVGDQNCSEPGIFRLKDPEEEILPTNGMVMIIPAHRNHSAIYNGDKDRVMLGINFYSLI